MKIWVMPCRAIQDIVKSSDKTWSTGGGNGNHFSILASRTPWTVWKAKRQMLEDEPSRSEGVQNTTEEEWRAITNISRKNETAGPKQKWCSVVHVSGGKRKVRYCKQQYCIGTWNFRSVNQGKLHVVKQDMERVNIHILGISELKWWSVVIVRIRFTK